MMRYSMTLTERDYQSITEHLFTKSGVEQAAYLLCRPVITETECRLLVRSVIPVIDDDIEERDAVHMKIKSRSFLRAMKKAHLKGEAFCFLHSHPPNVNRHSVQDDQEEQKLFRTAYNRITTEGVHASLIFTDSEHPIGRVWFQDGTTISLDVIRIIGNRFRFYFQSADCDVQSSFFDRQIQIFGQDIQALLGRLKIAVVGAGGTGSAVAEQLIRLGVGKLLIIDGDCFDPSNINRVYGSRIVDRGISKVKLVERLAADIGLGTVIETVQKPIFFESAFRHLRNCDVVFGCTDDEWGRSLLTRLAIYYFIPVFDIGVKIDSNRCIIQSIQGRVTTLIPSVACLYCRGRIKSDRVRAESLQFFNPEEAAHQRAEGYVPELEDPAPAVVTFTSAVASSAVLELLHRLTGCLGNDRVSSEVLHLFDLTRIRTNTLNPSEECFCNNNDNWGRGDRMPLMDITWPKE
jgi:hypothetical protein